MMQVSCSKIDMPNERMLNIPLPTEKIVLDPHALEDLYSMFILKQVHRGLFYYHPDGSIENYLADSWKWSKNKKVLSIKLANKKFSDGAAITSRHVVLSLARLFIKQSSMSSDLSYIQGSNDIKSKSYLDHFGVKEISKSEIEIHLKRHSDMLFAHLATVDCSILAIDSINSEIDFSKLPASGPYQLNVNTEGEIELILRKGFGTKKSPKAIRIIKTPNDKINSLVEKKSVDVLDIYQADLFDIDKLKNNGWRKIVSALGFENFILLNPKYYSKLEREFLINAVTPEAIVNELKVEWLKPAYGMIPPFMPGALSKVNVIKNANSKIKVKPVRLEFSRQSDFSRRVATAVAGIWKKSGIKVELVPLEITNYFDHLFQKKSQAILASKGIDYPDGYANLAYFRSDVKANYFFVEDNSLDKAISNLPFIEEENRAKKYIQIQKLLLDQHTFLPLFFGNNYSGLWHMKAAFVPEHPLGFHFLDLEEVQIE